MKSVCAMVLASPLLSFLPMPAAFASIPAGFQINNRANAQYILAGEGGDLSSNPVETRVGEVLDLRLTAARSGDLDVGTGEMIVIPYLLVNAGNGSEAFFLTPALDDATGGQVSLAIDTDGDGLFDPALDSRLPDGGLTPLLAAGGALRLLALVAATPAARHGTLSLHAQAATGSGVAGTAFPGRGDGGADAIVGVTTAAATAAVAFNARDADARVIKSQQVIGAQAGTDTAASGAVIAYRLEVVTAGGAALSHAELADPIPTGTDYVPGSLQIDGAVLSDADDDDNGRFDGTAIRVAFGDIVQPTTRVVTFQVKIK
jgi:uncharacterized repeat protein (TIGR01451 family)